jgi:hypothetical protein
MIAADPFILVASGRSLFQAGDLLELAGFVRDLVGKGSGDV